MRTKTIIPLVVIIPLMAIPLILFAVCVIRKKISAFSKVMKIARIVAILTLLFIINMRPRTKKYNTDVELKNIDVLFVVDTTMSMWANDYNNEPRMTAAVNDCAYIMGELAGSNFSLIRFDNRSQILAPFTQDSKNVTDAFATITRPSSIYAKGTSFNVAYKEMEEMLISSSKKEGRLTIVFFISDGEKTSNEEVVSFAGLEQYVDGGAVLGYGTEKGGKMYDDDTHRFIQDSTTGQDAVSKYDEANLKKLSEELNIDYIHMEKPENVSYLIDAIKSGSTKHIENSDNISYEDQYFIYVYPLIALLVLELVLIIRRGRI